MLGLISLLLSRAPALIDAIVQLASAPIAPPSPQTAVGRSVEAFLGVLRYAFVVVPVAIVATELRRERRARSRLRQATCERCGLVEGTPDAAYCPHCGGRLPRAAGA